jgi:hypothetical protein
MISNIVAIFNRVPDTIWSALIAAGIAILVMLLSNRNSRRQLQMQLDHTATQRDRDRAMALRRDVYLPAVEALVRSQAVLGKAVNLESDLTEIGNQLSADQATMAKIHLVGSETTVRALMTYMSALMPAYMELVTLRLPLTVRRQSIDAEQAEITRSLSQQQQLAEGMRQLNLAGNTDKPTWDRLRAQVAIEQEAFRTHTDKKAALWREQRAEMRQVFRRMTELLAPVSQLIPDAVIAAREEIELPINAEAYRQLFADQRGLMRASLTKFIDQVMPPQEK